jgi:hypothetical protein
VNEVARAKKRSKRVLAWLASFALVMILAEIACRIDALFPMAPFDSAKARAHFEIRREAGADQTLALYTAPDPSGESSSVRPLPHPFFGWTSERDVRVLEEQGRWFDSAESESTYDVFILGGSVAAEFGNRSAAKLEAALGAVPQLAGRRVRVWNNAHAGYKAPQTGNLLAWLFALGQRPDAVLLVDGFNEVAIGTTNARSGVHPAMPSFEFWGSLARGKAVDARALDLLVELHTAQRAEQAVARRAVDWGLYRSALATRITLARLAAKHGAFRDALERYLEYTRPKDDDPAVRGTSFDPAPPAVIAAAVRVWSENARLVESLCLAHGIAFVHVLQPTLYDPDSKPMTAEEARFAELPGAWMDGVRLGYPRLRDAGRGLSGAQAVFSDQTRLFEHTSETTYVDVCHLTELGCSILADAVVPEFARLLR